MIILSLFLCRRIFEHRGFRNAFEMASIPAGDLRETEENGTGEREKRAVAAPSCERRVGKRRKKDSASFISCKLPIVSAAAVKLHATTAS